MREKPAAIAAQLVDIRNVGQHKCVKLTIHVPAEQAGLVMEAFGWPTMVDPVPVALARMNAAGTDATAGEAVSSHPGLASPSLSPDKPLKERKPTKPEDRLKLRAALLCSAPMFWTYINERFCLASPICTANEAAEFVRAQCGVASRREIIPDTRAGDFFEALHSDFTIWRDHPELVAS